MAKREKIRKIITDRFEKYLSKLKLTPQEFVVLFPDEKGWEGQKDRGYCVKVQHPYRNIILYVPEEYWRRWKGGSINYQLDTLAHEAVHVLLWDYAKKAESRYISQYELSEAEEKAVDHLALLFLDLWH